MHVPPSGSRSRYIFEYQEREPATPSRSPLGSAVSPVEDVPTRAQADVQRRRNLRSGHRLGLHVVFDDCTAGQRHSGWPGAK